MLGKALSRIVWVWTRTLRVVVEGPDAALGAGRGPRVYAFLHGQQFGLLPAASTVLGAAADRARVRAVMVSHSADGELQAGVMGTLGMAVVRGSSSRGGARALAGIVRLLRAGSDALFAVDGPRGPAGLPKPGAALAAEASGAALFPVASAARRAIVLARTWDRFEIPLPFTRVAVVVGRCLSPSEARQRPEVLSASLVAARKRAEELVARGAPRREGGARGATGTAS